MAIIVDPDSLGDGTEITINTGAKTIGLTATGNLSSDGVTLQCVYSKAKELWRANTTYIKFPFPMTAITEEKFELVNGWDFANTSTRQLIRTGGWALKDGSGVSQEEYTGLITLGSIGSSDQVYYQQASGGSATNIVRTGAVNQAVKVYGDASHGDFDYRAYLKMFVREYAKTYASAQLSDIGVTNLTYQVYRFPLGNQDDLKITHDDSTVSSNAPYTGMTITWYASPQVRSIGGVNRDFSIIIDGNNGTAEEIYEFVQRELRQNADIDDGAGTKTGKVTSSLLNFVGDTLYTLYQSDTSDGVFIDNYDTNDINRLVFADDTANNRTFPFTATLTLLFNENLVNDPSAKYWVFFTNDDAGDNTGRDFGTANAMLVNDASAVAMSGNVSANASITKTFAFETNVQRGTASANTNAPITGVVIGANTAQYTQVTGTIARSVGNQLSFASALERNYSNP